MTLVSFSEVTYSVNSNWQQLTSLSPEQSRDRFAVREAERPICLVETSDFGLIPNRHRIVAARSPGLTGSTSG